MKDSVLKGHGVKRTTQGGFRGGGGANCDRCRPPVKFSIVVASRKVMRRIKGCSRKRPRRWTR